MTLADYLTTCGKDRAHFARAIGVTEAALSRYVTGQRHPRAEIMARIVRATGGKVTANDFMVGDVVTDLSQSSEAWPIGNG